ncbi:unnamed protein product [Fusarium fujikuroi]|uniref:Uncharacterized protein n=1 Tax=Fusarium fujikuroi TaxID=5127 RepID=A0A9Q9UCT9_FUSFU|nr:unnamed protein product [Fusarium fujikuroi]
MRRGNVICVLLGAEHHISYSRQQLRITYVHGLMDGEAVDGWEKVKWTENHEIQEKLFKLL